jgi:predicted DNA-binding transcriptional regulator YafY
VHDPERALTALSRGFGETHTTPTEPLTDCDVPPRPCIPSAQILAPISRAIHQRKALKITYSSFSSGKETREIVPFALADNGLRWHVRAFDRKKHRFADFVLTRFHQVVELSESKVAAHELPQNDLDWANVLELHLVPHPKEEHPEIVAMDYKMVDGLLKVRIRAALASYLLRQWLVDCSNDHNLQGPEYRLWLKNTSILYPLENARLAPGYSGPG